MFRVLIVDDEPSAVEYLCNLVRLKCPEFKVVATAENGLQGYELYSRLMPDLVISDVKMPVFNGLEMTEKIKMQWKKAKILLVSGYQEFEYVKAALKYGVSDYILKPVTPASFQAALEPIIRELQQKVYAERSKLAQALIKGESLQWEEIQRNFSEPSYYVAVVRENGLPRRFSVSSEVEIISEIENVMFIYGRDEREALYICPSAPVSERQFQAIMKNEIRKRKTEENFVTAVVRKKAVPCEKLPESVRELYWVLNGHISIGNSQWILIGETNISGNSDTESLKLLERCLEKKEETVFLEILKRMLEKAGQQRIPQIVLERKIYQIAEKVRSTFSYKGDILEEEVFLEDAFYNAGNVQDLYENLSEIFSRYWKKNKETIKLDSPEFFSSLKEYISNNLDTEITVASLCREFGISQSYLNLIFRKYENMSFNTYLRNTRIDRAKVIMKQNPQIFIKDVAEMIGYKDQFYFSRIFRAVVGMPPTEFMEEK